MRDAESEGGAVGLVKRAIMERASGRDRTCRVGQVPFVKAWPTKSTCVPTHTHLCA